jgi:hypothetical protein
MPFTYYITEQGIKVPLVVSTSRSFPHSLLINGFVTKLTRRVPQVEQELSTLPEHLSTPPGCLVPNFRSIRDRYTIRHHALYILHNRARYKMVWHQFEPITPGTETCFTKNSRRLLVDRYKISKSQMIMDMFHLS